MEAVNESGAAKVVGWADDDRGGRRTTKTENGRDSDVADKKPRHKTEAMHCKEGPNNIKLTNNKRSRCRAEKKTTNAANLQRGCKITTRQTQTQREVSSKTRKRVESENRQREQPPRRQGASGRHVWDTIRHYNNVTQAEPNDALQALTAQIPDRG